MAVYSMAGFLTTLDRNARKAVPLILELYGRTTWPEGRKNLDDSLCRVSGRRPLDYVTRDEDEAAQRLLMWQEWWRGVEEDSE
jgi:hypothetical protein